MSDLHINNDNTNTYVHKGIFECRILLYFIILFIFSCNNKEMLSEKIFNQFESNKSKLTNLANELLVSPEVDSLLKGEDKFKRKATEFPTTISKQLISLGLLEVSQHYWFCNKKSQKLFVFKTNWIPKDSLFIVYNICDTIETKKGYYHKDENLNEVWGAGNSWQFLKIVKYLTRDQ